MNIEIFLNFSCIDRDLKIAILDQSFWYEVNGLKVIFESIHVYYVYMKYMYIKGSLFYFSGVLSQCNLVFLIYTFIFIKFQLSKLL